LISLPLVLKYTDSLILIGYYIQVLLVLTLLSAYAECWNSLFFENQVWYREYFKLSFDLFTFVTDFLHVELLILFYVLLSVLISST
jgi:hypothetical protein